MSGLDFSAAQHSLAPLRRQTTRIDEQNDRLFNLMAINRLCRTIFGERRSKRNMQFAPERKSCRVQTYLRLVK